MLIIIVAIVLQYVQMILSHMVTIITIYAYINVYLVNLVIIQRINVSINAQMILIIMEILIQVDAFSGALKAHMHKNII